MGFDTVNIEHAGVKAEICPQRGAIVTQLSVLGKPVLYLDRATLDDGTKNVRGGIPVLFPYAGKLDEKKFVHAGTTMEQHGFGRNKAWAVTDKRPYSVTMTLEADSDTRKVYPYSFRAEQTVQVIPAGLLVELLVLNQDAKPLPVSPGWHPYFCCPGPQKGNVKGDVAGLTADKLGNDKEFDFGLVAPANGRGSFQVPSLGNLRISFEPAMRHMQFWSQPGKDFICIEPFWGPNNTVNTERRCDIPAGQARAFWMRMEVL